MRSQRSKMKSELKQDKMWNAKRFNKDGGRLDFAIAGALVDHVRFGGNVRLDFNDDFKTRVELWMPFSLTQYDQTLRLQPKDTTALAPLLSLPGCRLVKAVADRSGFLTMEFDNDMTLMAPADQDAFEYEAWQLTDLHGFHVVCAIGGQLSIWLPDAETSRRRSRAAIFNQD